MVHITAFRNTPCIAYSSKFQRRKIMQKQTKYFSSFCGIAALSMASAFSLAPASASAQEPTHDWGKTYASIARPSKTARCPTGYIASPNAQTCETFSLITPKAQPKSGACPAGTTEEFGMYCTPTVSDMSDRMAGLLAKHYFQDLAGVYMNSLGNATTMPMTLPPVLSAYLSKRAAAGQSSSLLRDNSPTPALPAALPIQCGSNFGSGMEEALRCNEAIGIARGQQAQAGMPPTTQQQITGAGAAPAAAPAVAAPGPAAANTKDALKQGLKGLLSK
jgi:hypothetical protein